MHNLVHMMDNRPMVDVVNNMVCMVCRSTEYH